MNDRGKKLEPKLGLDMPFDEALRRFVQTKPKEVDQSIETAKETKPPPKPRPKPKPGNKPSR